MTSFTFEKIKFSFGVLLFGFIVDCKMGLKNKAKKAVPGLNENLEVNVMFK